MISLIRDLFELFDNIVNCQQHALDQEYTNSDNLTLYMILIDVIDTNRFENFNSKKMHNALSKFKVFVEDLNIDTLNTMKWSMRMMKFLSINFSEKYLIIYCESRV